MIDLTKARLPQAVEVCGSYYAIHTDFKYILRFIELLKNKNNTADVFDFIYISKKPKDKNAGFEAICHFINPPHEIPRKTDDDSGEVVLDYTIDADFIFSAFMEKYSINLVYAKLHWYEFTALLRGLKDTKLNEIISYRSYKNESGRNDEYNKSMQKLYNAWRLPQPEDDEPDEALDEFLSRLEN